VKVTLKCLTSYIVMQVLLKYNGNTVQKESVVYCFSTTTRECADPIVVVAVYKELLAVYVEKNY